MQVQKALAEPVSDVARWRPMGIPTHALVRRTEDVMQLSSQPVIVDDAFDGRRTAAACKPGVPADKALSLL